MPCVYIFAKLALSTKYKLSIDLAEEVTAAAFYLIPKGKKYFPFTIHILNKFCFVCIASF